MGVTFEGYSCLDPKVLYEECAQRNLPIDTWFRRANSFTCPMGGPAGRGWFLVSRDVLDQLDIGANDAFREVVFFNTTERVALTLSNLLIVNHMEAQAPGYDGDPATPYLIEVADKRWLYYDRGQPIKKLYNYRSDVDGTYISSSLNSGTAWTWQGMLDNLWPSGLGTAPTLPFTPDATPENFCFPDWTPLRCVDYVLTRLACGLKYDPIRDTFGYERLGLTTSTSATQSDLLTTRYTNDGLLIRDDYPLTARTAAYPEKLRVEFRVKIPYVDKTLPLYTVDNTVSPTAATVAVGSYVLLQDDLTAQCDNTTVSNAAALTTRATERYNDWVRKRQYFDVDNVQVYDGFLDLVPVVGAYWAAIGWYDRGSGMRTEIVSGRIQDLTLERWQRNECENCCPCTCDDDGEEEGELRPPGGFGIYCKVDSHFGIAGWVGKNPAWACVDDKGCWSSIGGLPVWACAPNQIYAVVGTDATGALDFVCITPPGPICEESTGGGGGTIPPGGGGGGGGTIPPGGGTGGGGGSNESCVDRCTRVCTDAYGYADPYCINGCIKACVGSGSGTGTAPKSASFYRGAPSFYSRSLGSRIGRGSPRRACACGGGASCSSCSGAAGFRRPPARRSYYSRWMGIGRPSFYSLPDEWADASGGLTSPVAVADGGTGKTTATAGSILYAATATPTSFTELTGTEGQTIQFNSSNIPAPVTVPIGREKTVDETINSDAVLGNDAALTYALAANTRYRVELKVDYNTTINAGYQWDLTGPGSLTRLEGLVEDWLAGAADFVKTAVDGTYPTGGGGATANTNGFVRATLILHTGASSGTLAFRWAQNTSHADSTTTRAGSVLRVTKLN